MSKRTASKIAFALAGILLLILAIQGKAATTIAAGALAIIGAVAGVNLS